MEIAVTLEGVTKRFGDLVAVEEVSFSAGGEIFGIIGNNGAGKSTLFQMIVGLLRPDAGRITRFGGKGGDPRAQIGYLPEKTLLYPRLTPWEFLDFVARIRGIPAPPIDEELERFHLRTHRDDLIEGLSFGMRRKVGLIAAMLGAPPLVILDEPLNGLDVESMDLVEARLREIVGGGRSVLFSSHYLDFAERICDRVAVLRRGRLLACDTPAALREAYGKASLLEIFRMFHRKDAPHGNVVPAPQPFPPPPE